MPKANCSKLLSTLTVILICIFGATDVVSFPLNLKARDQRINLSYSTTEGSLIINLIIGHKCVDDNKCIKIPYLSASGKSNAKLLNIVLSFHKEKADGSPQILIQVPESGQKGQEKTPDWSITLQDYHFSAFTFEDSEPVTHQPSFERRSTEKPQQEKGIENVTSVTSTISASKSTTPTMENHPSSTTTTVSPVSRPTVKCKNGSCGLNANKPRDTRLFRITFPTDSDEDV